MNRRQKFLTATHYNSVKKYFDEEKRYWKTHSIQADTPEQENYLKARRICDSAFQGLLLDYTSGIDICSLTASLEDVVAAYERMQIALSISERNPLISPLNLAEWPDEFEEAVQIIGLCVLLHRQDLLKRFAALFDAAGYKGQDLLFEDLVRNFMSGRADIDEWYHPVYTQLIQAVYEADRAEASVLLAEYCKNWYSAFENSPWYDSHKDDEGTYFGYWAIEAGAIAYLYGIDDSKVDHIVYPKALVEYARAYKSIGSTAAVGKAHAGQLCTRSGFWFSTAQQNSRHFFKKGEIMPEFKGSPWGSTIWYWSGENE
jgi:hypothetical protein